MKLKPMASIAITLIRLVIFCATDAYFYRIMEMTSLQAWIIAAVTTIVVHVIFKDLLLFLYENREA